MKELFACSSFAGVFLTVCIYEIAAAISRKSPGIKLNPLPIAIVLCMIVLKVTGIPYEMYRDSAQPVSWLLTPATTVLAIPLYRQLGILMKNKRAVLGGVFMGVLASLISVLAFSVLFGLNRTQFVTLLPKSVTTPIGMAVAGELGGDETIAVAAIVITGILGNTTAPAICRFLRIKSPVARGVLIGTSSHALGTAKAIEMGEIEGAMSSIALVISGLLTVAAAPLFVWIFERIA